MKVAVIIPAYNAEKTLEQAIDSIRNQTVKADEIIVVDDGSKDSTVSLARELGATVLEQPNSGPSIARNNGIKHSTSDIIFLLDADDVWQPTKIEEHMKVWETGHKGLVYDWVQRVRANGSLGGVGGFRKTSKVKFDELINPKNWTCGSSYSYRRDDFLAIGGFRSDLRFAEDIEFMIRYTHAFGDAHCILQTLTEYRLHPNSASNVPIDPHKMTRSFVKTLYFLNVSQRRNLHASFAMHQIMQFRGTKFLRLPWDALPILLKQKRFYRIMAIKMLRLITGSRSGFVILFFLMKPAILSNLAVFYSYAKLLPILLVLGSTNRFMGRKGNPNSLVNTRNGYARIVVSKPFESKKTLPGVFAEKKKIRVS